MVRLYVQDQLCFPSVVPYCLSASRGCERVSVTAFIMSTNREHAVSRRSPVPKLRAKAVYASRVSHSMRW